MNPDEIRKLIVGPMANVTTPFDDEYRVDLGRMAELTQMWVEQGLVKGRTVLKVVAVMGENALLRDDEWPSIVRTAVRASNGRATVACGIHYKDTIRAIQDLKVAEDRGAVAVQVCAPIFNDPTQDDILRFYEALSDADAVDVGIIIYNTPWLAHGGIALDTMKQICEFEQVVAIKWAPNPGDDYESLFEYTDRVSIIDNTRRPTVGHKLGGRGYINMTVDEHPPHDFRVWDLMEEGRYDEAEEIFESVALPLWDFHAKLNERSGGVARTKKGMAILLGHPMGPMRPPSLPLSEEELDELRGLLEGWGWPVVSRQAAQGVPA